MKDVTEDGCGMDYEVIAICEMEVAAPLTPDGFTGCGEPATYRVWWGNDKDKMPVCQEHFEYIRECDSCISCTSTETGTTETGGDDGG